LELKFWSYSFYTANALGSLLGICRLGQVRKLNHIVSPEARSVYEMYQEPMKAQPTYIQLPEPDRGNSFIYSWDGWVEFAA